MIGIVRILAGLGLLTLGRKLFWLFVAAIGFLFGFIVADRFFQRGVDDIIAFIIALAFGVIGALLAVFLQTLAIYVGGFIAGGSILVNLFELLGVGGTRPENLLLLILFIVGGIIGAILVRFIFDWALIILSSLAGAGMIARAVGSGGAGETIVYVILVIVGIVIQALTMQREKT